MKNTITFYMPAPDTISADASPATREYVARRDAVIAKYRALPRPFSPRLQAEYMEALDEARRPYMAGGWSGPLKDTRQLYTAEQDVLVLTTQDSPRKDF